MRTMFDGWLSYSKFLTFFCRYRITLGEIVSSFAAFAAAVHLL